MSYICGHPEAYKGKVVGTGQCVDFVKIAAHAPQTAAWKQGAKIKAAKASKGTAIATFVNGKYPNHATGNHAAIYVRQDSIGIYVWDQWKNGEGSFQPVHERCIRFKKGIGDVVNDGDAFSVVE